MHLSYSLIAFGRESRDTDKVLAFSEDFKGNRAAKTIALHLDLQFNAR